MKELSIEEKAQRYDEAIERAKAIYQGSYKPNTAATIAETLQSVFPELKESEGEIIIKALISGFKMLEREYNLKGLGGIKFEKILAWLEKQGEKILANSAKTCKDEQSHAWSEEDEKMIEAALQFAHEYGRHGLWCWLKSLKDRVLPQNITYYNPYKEVVESITEMCKHYDKASHNGLRDFYDNVKVKCKDAKEYDSLFPQNTWKPSDEMLEALYRVIPEFVMAKSEDEVLLDKLYQGLKYGKVLSEK